MFKKKNKIKKIAQIDTQTEEAKPAAHRRRSKFIRFMRKYGLITFLLIVVSFIYLFWTYITPLLIHANIAQDKVSSYLENRIGFRIRYSEVKPYTTTGIAIGLIFKNPELLFPETDNAKDFSFLKARSATVEIPVIPYLLKTVRFNKLYFNSVNIDAYQNDKGEFIFKNNIYHRFNPQMPKYMLEVPDIQLIGYKIKNYNDKTDKYKEDAGNEMTLKAADTKFLLRQVKHKTIIIK